MSEILVMVCSWQRDSWVHCESDVVGAHRLGWRRPSFNGIRECTTTGAFATRSFATLACTGWDEDECCIWGGGAGTDRLGGLDSRQSLVDGADALKCLRPGQRPRPRYSCARLFSELWLVLRADRLERSRLTVHSGTKQPKTRASPITLRIIIVYRRFKMQINHYNMYFTPVQWKNKNVDKFLWHTEKRMKKIRLKIYS